MRWTILVPAVMAAMLNCSVRGGEQWSEFRGPGGSGSSTAAGLPLKWSESQNVTWKTAIHGKGWSSPVIWDDQIWMTTATEDGKRMFAVCVDLHSGKIVHDLLLFENEKPAYCHPANSYASPTPVIEEGRVYLHFGTYGTACLDTASGKTVWSRRDLLCNHFRGPGSSPLLDGERLILTFDGFDLQYVAALDKRTGKTLWKKNRDIKYPSNNGDLKKAFGTPTVIEFARRRQLVSPSAVATIAYDPKSGEELWKVYHGGMNVAARPQFGHGLLFINTGPGGDGLIGVRPDGRGDVTKSHVVWKYRKSVPKRASHLLIGDSIYMFHDSGVATCLKAKTGEMVWQRRLPGKFWSSPIYADGRIYCFSKDGICQVIEPGQTFKLLATNHLESGFWSTPAIAGKAIFPRSETHLYRLELTKSKPASKQP